MKHFIYLLLFSNLFLGCNDSGSKKQSGPIKISKDKLVDSNKRVLEIERLQIDSYIKRHQLTPITTGTGLRIQYIDLGEGIQPVSGDVVAYEATIRLLNGREIVPEKKKYTIRLDKTDIESGINEGLLTMRLGGHALLIVPHHLGHGLTGDLGKIPPLSTLLVDVHLKNIL